MGWRSRAPWIVAGIGLLLAVAGHYEAVEERAKYDGVPEQLTALADKIEGEAVKREELELRVKRTQHVVALLAIAPEGPTQQHPEWAEKLRGMRDDSECMQALAGAVVRARLSGKVTAADRSEFVTLALECLK